MDEFINLIIFGVLILLSTVFGGKKKKKAGGGPRPAPTVPRPQPKMASRTTEPLEEEPWRETAANPPVADPAEKPGSFREFFELLQEQAEAASQGEPQALERILEPPPPPAPVPPSRPVRAERGPAKSIETLEAAGGKSHVQFHAKYIRPLDGVPTNVPPHFVLPRDPVSLKRAVIWSEILGSPKGME